MGSLLITGVSGVTGYNALPFFRHHWPGPVVGVRPRETARLTGEGILGLDLEDREALHRLFQQHSITHVLHCGGNCALKACELDPAMAHRINVLGTQNLLDAAEGHAARFVFLSCDLVFSGARAGGYRESDTPDPVTVYGKTMVEAEQRVLEARPDGLVLRISLPMGPSFNRHAGAIDWIQSRFRKGKPATLYFDEERTPTYTDDMNSALLRLLELRSSGLFHFGGPRRLSLFQIAQVVNRVGGYDPALLHGCPRKDAGPIPPRAGNVSLDSSRLAEMLGHSPFRPWPHDDELVPTDRDWHRFRSDESPGSESLIERFLYRPGHRSAGARLETDSRRNVEERRSSDRAGDRFDRVR